MSTDDGLEVDSQSHHASLGYALPDGSFRVTNRAELALALKLFPKAKNKDEAKKHLLRRARQLHAEDLLPHDWLSDQYKAATSDTNARPQLDVSMLVKALQGDRQAAQAITKVLYAPEIEAAKAEIAARVAELDARLRHLEGGPPSTAIQKRRATEAADKAAELAERRKALELELAKLEIVTPQIHDLAHRKANEQRIAELRMKLYRGDI